MEILMRKDLEKRGDLVPFTVGLETRYVNADQVRSAEFIEQDDDGYVFARTEFGRGWFYSVDLDFQNTRPQCSECGYEWSACLGDDEGPTKCEGGGEVTLP